MPVAVCPSCERKLKAPEGAERRKIRCPACRATLLLSGGELSLVPEPVTDTRAGRPERRSRPNDDKDDRPRRSRRTDPEEDDQDRPRKRRQSEGGGGIPMWVWIAGGGGLLAVGGLILVLVLVLGGGDGYDKIKNGMSEKEVKDILGKPKAELLFGGNGEMMWEKSEKVITVSFKDGKVINKAKLDLKELTKDMGKFK